MDPRTQHDLALSDAQKRKVEDFANAAAKESPPPTSKKNRTRRGYSKWWRGQVEKMKRDGRW